MLDHVTEIPLPGRSLNASQPQAEGRPPPLPASFVAGPENVVVASAIARLMESAAATTAPQQTRLVPPVTVLFGQCGTGKTHLARGLVRYWQDQRGAATAAYMTAAEFRQDLNEAIKHRRIVEFRTELRGHELLALDDLQQLVADGHVLQELRYTLDAYEEQGGAVIVTSSKPVTTLTNLPPDVVSRLAGGLVLQLDTPGSAARVRIVAQAALAHGRSFSEAATVRLARGVNGTAHQLYGAVAELCTSEAAAIEAENTEAFLAARAARRPTLREIVAVVARHQGLPQSQLKSSSRRQSVVFARAIAVYLARELSGASYEQIGRALGGRDHTTIIHSFRKIDEQRRHDPQTGEMLSELRRILSSS